LGDLSAASRLAAVRKKPGCRETSPGSFSEALRLFDPERLNEILQDLLGRISGTSTAGELTSVPLPDSIPDFKANRSGIADPGGSVIESNRL